MSPTPAPMAGPSTLLDPGAWCSQHPRITAGLGAFCLWVSACLIIRLWLVHRPEPFLKKLCWSGVLLIPFLGWFVYGGCFTPLDAINTPCPQEHDWGDASGGFGGHD